MSTKFSMPVHAFAPPTVGSELDTKGTDFWVAFNQNFSGSTADPTFTLKLFITGERSTSGTVSIPGLDPPFSATFTVTAGAVTSVDIPATAQLTSSGLPVAEHKGIHITALDEVTVYGLNRREASTDAFLALPTDILGTEYITLGYANNHTNFDPANRTEFAIVGTQANTHVTLTPPPATMGTLPVGLLPSTFILNAGDTFQLGSGAQDVDLSGVVVSADHAVAVFGAHSYAQVPVDTPSSDHIVEELTPTSTWGRNFVTAPLATRKNGDVFRFLASTPDTHITVTTLDGIDEVEDAIDLNRGEYTDYLITTVARITSNNPIFVAQYSPSTNFDNVTSDPFMVLIPPYEQFQSAYTITTVSNGLAPLNGVDRDFTSYVNLVVPQAGLASLMMDGASIDPLVILDGGVFHPIPGSTFSGAQVRVAKGAHRFESAYPFGITVYGFANQDSYGYPGGMSLAPVALAATVTLAPPTETLLTGQSGCVTATVRDQVALPLTGVRVDFHADLPSVNAPAIEGGNALTDAAGHALFCYTGTHAGHDTITATVSTLTSNELVTKTWQPPIDALDDLGQSVNGFVGGTSVATVLVNDALNGDAIDAATVTISFISSANAGVTLDTATGAVSVAAGTPASVTPYALVYNICEKARPGNCDSATAYVPVTAAPILAVDDPGAPVNGFTGGTSISDVVVGTDTLNGVVITTTTRAKVTLSRASPTTGSPLTLDLTTGAVTVAAGTAASGATPYTLVYRICEILNPSNCATANVTVPVTAPVVTPIDALNDSGHTISSTAGGTSVGNVLTNDTLNGTAITPSLVILTFVSSTNADVTLNTTSGAVNVTAGTPASGATPYLLVYRICEVASPANCDTATVTVTVTSPAPPPPPTRCVRGMDDWRTQRDWPVTSLKLGTATYTKVQLLQILEYAARADRTKNGLVVLAADLIVARLNQATGAPVPANIPAALAQADALIGGRAVPPIGLGSLTLVTINAVDCLLDAYNRGALPGGPPDCRNCKPAQDNSHDRDDQDERCDRDGDRDHDRDCDRDDRDGRRDRDDCDRDDRDRWGRDDDRDRGPHHEGDGCVDGKHGHRVNDRCEGRDGAHHDGDGCDARSSVHVAGVRKDARCGG